MNQFTVLQPYFSIEAVLMASVKWPLMVNYRTGV